MVANPAALFRHLRRLVSQHHTDADPDPALLERFVRCRDEGAFAVLVGRHGPLVLRVCQRVLADPHAAEDAFQATFLVLARRAAAIRRRQRLAGWLHGVAYRVALKARAAEALHQCREAPSANLAPPDPHLDPLAELTARELLSVLDEEVQRLPEVYRLPVLLCCLEGHSQEEAARILGWTAGSVRGRLERGRARLRDRLARRGLTLPAALAVVGIGQGTASAGLSAALAGATARAALAFVAAGGAPAGAIPARVTALAEGGLKSMAAVKLKIGAALLLVLSVLAAGAGLAAYQARQTEPPSREQEDGRPALARGADKPQLTEKPPVRTDRHGDPLPDAALVRLGTLRWRAIGEVDSSVFCEGSALAFAPDGKMVVAATDHGLWLFDAANGKLTKHIRPAGTYSPSIAFSPDGTRLACSCTTDREKGVVQVWEWPDWRKVQEFKAENLMWLGWSAAGQPLAILLGKEVVLLRELATGKERRFEAKDLPDLGALRLARADTVGGKVVAVSDERCVIHVWDAATGEKRCALQSKGGHVRDLVFSPDGRLLASFAQDRATGRYTVQLWDVATGKVTHTVATDQKVLASVAFTPDSKTLATVGWHDVRFWDVATGRERSRAQDVHSFAPSIAFSPDSKTLLTAERYGGTLHLWDVATGTRKPEPAGHTSEPHWIAFSPDGRRLVTGGAADGTIIVWDPATGKPLAQVHRSGGVRGCAFSADGRSLFSLGDSDKLYVFDAATGRELHVLKVVDPDQPDTQQMGRSIHLSGDGKTLVALSYSGRKDGPNGQELLVIGWDTATRKQLFLRWRPPQNEIGITVSVDAGILAAPGAADVEGKKVPGLGPMQLEDLATGEHRLTFPALEGQTWPLAFSPDSRLLASYTYGPVPRLAVGGGRTGERGETLRLWEVTAAAEVLALPTVTNSCVAFSRDGCMLAMTTPEQEILLWDLRRGKELRRIKGFGADVTSLAFSPDGRRLVSGLSDTTLLVWDVAAVREAGKPAGLDAEGVARAWADLGADARTAFAARGALAESPERAVPLLRERLKPAQPADAKRLRQLLADLDSERFAVREEARKGLEAMGDLATGALRRALTEKPTLEVHRQIEALLEKQRVPITRPEALQALRAVAVLEDIATPEAKEVLQKLAEGAPEARLTQAAKVALERLARRAVATP